VTFRASMFRRLAAGLPVESECGRWHNDRQEYRHTPQPVGSRICSCRCWSATISGSSRGRVPLNV